MTAGAARYAAMFDRLAARGEGAFGAFVMLGDPSPAATPAILDALIAGGADMIEVGIPFSDPIADGPVIQAAAERALAAGGTAAACFELLSAAATPSTVPVPPQAWTACWSPMSPSWKPVLTPTRHARTQLRR